MKGGTRPQGAESTWTLAFAIVMLLLFAVFLILYSTSKREERRLREEVATVRSERSAARPERSAAPDSGISGDSQSGALDANADLQSRILAEARSFLVTGPEGDRKSDRSDVEVMDLTNGDFLVRVAAPDLFEAGGSRIAGEMRAFVDRLGALVVKSGRRLRIEGHADFADSEAIQRRASAFANTWELSAARSAGMAQYWMRKFDLDPAKIEVGAYGKFRPLETLAGRSPQANRRIEIVILRAQ